MKITKVNIAKFRGFLNQAVELGEHLTAIAGQNGTQKSTLLGIITQSFTLKKENPMSAEKPLCGGSYRSAFAEKFRLSPVFDTAGSHEWTLSFDKGLEDFTIESIARSGSDTIRFWKKGARQAGDGYIDYPTIYLSLKRLVPLAEDAGVSTKDDILTEEEKIQFKALHNKILISQIPIQSATGIISKNKNSLGVSTNLYDWNQNSMGQDNIGKIILALFSFQRLKQKYPNHYKGGILAIDELDATMYPASQIELLRVLRKYASDLKLQILFTTHSLSLLDAVDYFMKETSKRVETSRHIKMVYLKRVDNQIHIKTDIDMEAIRLNLTVSMQKNSSKRKKITVYSEDKEDIVFAKAILKSKSSQLNFVDVPMSCSQLIDLVTKKVPAFSRPFSIIVLDGDVRNDRGNKKKLESADNVLILPGMLSPERLVAKYLYELSDENLLWAKVAKGYSKQVCFRDITFEQINASGECGRQDAKKWFNQQLDYWGRNGSRVLNPFFESIQSDRDEFIATFDKIIKTFI